MGWPVRRLLRWAIISSLAVLAVAAFFGGASAAILAIMNMHQITPGAGGNIVPVAALSFTLFNGLLVACNLALQRIDNAENSKRLAEVEAREDRRREEDELRELIRAFQTVLGKLEAATVGSETVKGTDALVVLAKEGKEAPLGDLEAILVKSGNHPRYAGAARLLQDLVAIRKELVRAMDVFLADEKRKSLGIAMLSALSSVEREVLYPASAGSNIPVPEAPLD